ncbi:NitT/TauT family transport system ATP-binding protein [Streptomyces africanus]|uniref:NitT/TauT family transport system ATP-binding protein n=1 Tax=Streptomyces africanus TaxID=231024 RepID=A0ABU0R275_9ACTN|nr:NitT/TauT family transport system ATP-binding protein [Streptomyces africanus]
MSRPVYDSPRTAESLATAEAPPAPQAVPVRASAVPPALELRGVSKSFGHPGGDQLVLDDISLAVAPGEFVCLLGASGCGKSTLLGLAAGIDEPSAGTVSAEGPRPALMFQEHALFPWLTAGKNIELALRLRGVPRRERRPEAERLLGLVRLNGAYGKRVHELSGGMRQRVALARALAQASQVLLMDEPFAALDAITRDLLHDELIRVWHEWNQPAGGARSLSVLFVTHNVREAVRLGGRVVLLASRPGRIARQWRIDLTYPRRLEDEAVAEKSKEITEELRKEISRHAGS